MRTAHGSSGVEGKDAGRRYQQPPEDRGSTNEEKKYVKSQSKKSISAHSCRLGTYFVLKICPPLLA